MAIRAPDGANKNMTWSLYVSLQLCFCSLLKRYVNTTPSVLESTYQTAM